MRAADQGTLRKPEVLAAQVRRMLKDPKARALVENFAGQWLEFRRLESVAPDREKFPEFDDYLRMSMRQETEMFFENLIREDRSMLDLIDAKYTFLNEKLAAFYGIPGVKGTDFRQVISPDPARRRADAGQRADGVVVRDAHVAGAARQVDSGELPEFEPIPPPPPNVPRWTRRRSARPDRCARRWRSIARIPCARPATQDGPARLRALRTSTRSANGGRRTASSRSTLPARCPTAAASKGAAELKTLLREGSRRLRRVRHR